MKSVYEPSLIVPHPSGRPNFAMICELYKEE